MKVATITLGVCIALFGSASTSRAQPATTPDSGTSDRFLQGKPKLAESLSGRAKEEYDAAHLLLKNGDYAGALVKFRTAFELSGDVRLLWNLAACEKNLRHYARALRWLEHYRADAGLQLTEAHRADVNQLMRTLVGLVSRVRVQVDQADASVFVDGELQGRTPLSDALLIDLGRHQIRVAKPGFVDAVIAQELSGGSELSIPITLLPEARSTELDKPSVARLSVKASAGATLWIDGKRVGEQAWHGELKPGTHTLRVSAPDMIDEERVLALNAGELQTLDITLKRRPSKLSPLVWIGAGVVAASALAVGGYFLVRGTSESAQPYVGSLYPGTIPLPRQ